MTFDRLPPDRKIALVEHLAAERGWAPDRAERELREMDDVGIAYVGVERRLAQRRDKDYDPLAEMFVLR